MISKKTLLMILSGIIFITCDDYDMKKVDNAVLPEITTSAISSVTTNSASCGGEVTSDGGAAVTARGVCWGTTHNPTTANSKSTDGTGNGSFNSSMTGLSPNTTYYVRAYATNSAGTSYGNEVNFITLQEVTSPTVTTSSINDITTNSASCGGNVTSDGGSAVTARGVCWSASQNPTTANSKTTDGTGTGSFTSSMTGLSPNTTYYVRAYATNSIGTAYGTEYNFSTNAIGSPAVTTTTISNIATNSASGGGNVTSDGGSTVTVRGVCWSTSQNPTTANSKTTDGTGTGSFTSSITGLTSNTTYYVRAYATNSAGTAYGNQVSFTTIGLATVTTTVISNITTSTASSGGNVTSDGGSAVTARGVCWSTSQNPTTANSKTTDGTGTGSFTSSMTGLTSNTTYYVRAYATNSTGTAYGTEYNFSTNAIGSPTVTTTTISNITTNSASGGGNVTSDGGSAVTVRGVCWSTSQNPTTANSKTTDGTGTGSFTSSITGLSSNTTYYVRAYATNSAGTAYGNQVSFSTIGLAALTTTAISNVTTSTASSGGNVSSDGGSTVTVRGVCWSTSQNPTTADSKTTDGTGTGSFTSSITGLSSNTTYYVRAYATNSAGTAYGVQLILKSYNSTVTDIDGNTYFTVIIGTQEWTVQNLKTNRYRNGDAIPFITDAGTWSGLTAGAYCYYNNDSSYFADYGKLYNWHVVNDSRNIAPAGWHVPTNDDWWTLINYLGGYGAAGGKLKEAGFLHWNSPNEGATNETGFTAFGGGYRGNNGTYYGIWVSGSWWTSLPSGQDAWYWYMYSVNSQARDGYTNKNAGMSIRCVKD